MKMKYFVGLLAVLLAVGCSTSKNTQSDNVAYEKRKQDFKGQRQLIDYLRREPGVEVRGGGNNILVLVRGVKSITGNNNPLYVVDGVQMGNDYNQVAALADRFAIENVIVLPPPRSGRYGSLGQNGVIEITTRKE
ncbi:MAG: TonB-dependent receptor plug domain-containing protein [Saprospiraceae bacterium]|nr:TonB-dependent receptor plug domain-containing protein [Saprospiraceae bacterium]